MDSSLTRDKLQPALWPPEEQNRYRGAQSDTNIKRSHAHSD